MKPARFEYVAARSLEEAAAALQQDEDARVLAGGQSLLPLLNLRLARPSVLVDINPIPSVLRRSGGTLHIGVTLRQATLERSPLVQRHWPLLGQAVRHVGHAATRARGTVCGSVAHADPAAELPTALLALDARYVTSRGRTLTDFADGPFTTRLEPGELLVSITVPPLPHGARTAFHEYARTHGAFATAAAAVVLARDHAAVAVLGAGRATDAEDALRNGASAEQAAKLAGKTVTDPHRRALVTELTRRALVEAGRA